MNLLYFMLKSFYVFYMVEFWVYNNICFANVCEFKLFRCPYCVLLHFMGIYNNVPLQLLLRLVATTSGRWAPQAFLVFISLNDGLFAIDVVAIYCSYLGLRCHFREWKNALALCNSYVKEYSRPWPPPVLWQNSVVSFTLVELRFCNHFS